MTSAEEEVLRKTLDQMVHLASSYEVGMISGEAYKLSVESIWHCLSGVFKSDAFNNLWTTVNAELRELPDRGRTDAFIKNDKLMVINLKGETSCVIYANEITVRRRTDEFNDDAAARIKRIKHSLFDTGYEPI